MTFMLNYILVSVGLLLVLIGVIRNMDELPNEVQTYIKIPAALVSDGQHIAEGDLEQILSRYRNLPNTNGHTIELLLPQWGTVTFTVSPPEAGPLEVP
jgi:hypothetical protein